LQDFQKKWRSFLVESERPGPGRQLSRYEHKGEKIAFDGFADAVDPATGNQGRFLAEEDTLTEEEVALIAEGRKEDAEKKYPQVNRFVDRLANLDPSKNNKYLMWMVKQLAAELASIEKVRGRDPEAVKQDFNPQDEYFVDLFNHAIKIGDEIAEFHKNIQRIKNKDINSYKSLDNLASVNKELGFSKRQKRKGEKMKALEDVEVLIENDYFVLARPLTVEAAAYLGGARGATSWCIARGNCAVEGYSGEDEWYTKYTDQGKAFYYIISKFLPKNDLAYLQALTIDADFSLEAISNRKNEYIEESDFHENMKLVLMAGATANPEKAVEVWDNMYTGEKTPEIIQKVIKTIVDDFGDQYDENIEDVTDVDEIYDIGERIWDSVVSEIEWAAREDAEYNPAGPREDDFYEVLSQVDLQHIDIEINDPRDYGGTSWYWSGTMSIDVSLSDDFQWVDTGDENPSPDDYEDEIPKIFKEAFDEFYYVDNVEYESYDETVRVSFTPDNDEDTGISGFKEFIERMVTYDGQYENARARAIELLGIEGALPSETYDKRKQFFDEMMPSFANLNTKFEKGVIKIFTPELELYLPGLLEALNYDKLEDTRNQRQREMGATSATQKAFIDRYTSRMEMTIRSPYTNFLKDWLAKVVSMFIDIEHEQGKQMRLPLAENKSWAKMPYTEFNLDILAVDVEVSPQPHLKGTILLTIPMEYELDRIQDNLKFASYFDKYINDCYKILVDQVLEVAKMHGKGAMEEEPQLFAPHAGSQVDPDDPNWAPGMPTPGSPEALAEKKINKLLTTHKNIYESWTKYLKRE